MAALELSLDEGALAGAGRLAEQCEQLWAEGLAAEAEQARRAKAK